jgi:hypothetical protein
LNAYYQSHIKTTGERLQKKLQLDIYYSILRGVLFISILISIYYLIKYPAWPSVCCLGLAIVAFLFILKKSDKNDKTVRYYQALKKVCEQELAGMLHGQFFHDNGTEFIDPNHPYTGDLDVFGEHSLFHSLNRCHTFSGYVYLANQLSNPSHDIRSIHQRQEAIKELQRDKKDFIFHLLALLAAKEKQPSSSNENIYLWLQQPYKFNLSKTMLWLIRILPVFNLILLGMAFTNPAFYSILLLFMIVQGIIFNHYNKSIQTIKRDLNTIISDVSNFDIYTDALKKINFHSTWLQHIQKQTIKYHLSIHQLHQMLSVFDMGDSFIGAFGNFFWLSHIKNAVKLEQWKKSNQETLPKLIENICEWETLISLTVFALNHPKFLFPEILEISSTTVVKAQNLGHPLIPEEKNVTNEIAIHKNNIFIITGANMAGKSTFLRTVGINMLLAQTGAPVCASAFRCIPVSLFTSMRTIDDLGNGISYFYAEALRIKQLLTYVVSGKPFLLLMDELFRGTNSDDRLKSSLSFIRKLTCYSEVSALIATHDLGVTILENEYPEKIKNYCFECEHQGEQITFDYKLKNGITQSYNAYRLLQQMQIVD